MTIQTGSLLGSKRRGFLLSVIPWVAAAQKQASTKSDYIGLAGLPSIARSQANRLGDRVVKPGKERLILSGTFSDTQVSKVSAQLVYQIPNKFRVQVGGSQPKATVFDGETPLSSKSQMDADDEALLESLFADSPDGFFETLRDGGALRLLGRRFRPSPKTAPNYEGPLSDIYELAGSVPTSTKRLTRAKLFYFDSVSELLSHARYVDATRGSRIQVETRFQNWVEVNGVPSPMLIERREGEKLVFSFTAVAASVQPRGDDRIFRDPSLEALGV